MLVVKSVPASRTVVMSCRALAMRGSLAQGGTVGHACMEWGETPHTGLPMIELRQQSLSRTKTDQVRIPLGWACPCLAC